MVSLMRAWDWVRCEISISLNSNSKTQACSNCCQRMPFLSPIPHSSNFNVLNSIASCHHRTPQISSSHPCFLPNVLIHPHSSSLNSHAHMIEPPL